MLLASVLGFGLGLFSLIVCVDPWDVLPLSPPAHRIPISTNARYTMPALARSPRFDSTILGTSTARLLRPDVLDRALGVHLSNMAMNSASPWEQAQLLALFLRHHPAPRLVIVDIDQAWCQADATTIANPNRPFPAWMYDETPWAGYLHMANLYAVQEAANQFMWLIGAKAQRYGSDGYTNFVPPDDTYDPKRVAELFAGWPHPDGKHYPPAPPPASLPLLTHMMDSLPAPTRKILFLPPLSAEIMGATDSANARAFEACRAALITLAHAMPNISVVDFNISGPITDERANFWDPIHYRVGIAGEIMADLALVQHDPGMGSERFRVLGRR